MADLSEYMAAVDRAIDVMCEEAEIPRALVDAASAENRAMEERWLAREALLIDQARRKAEPMGEAFAEAFRIAARETGRDGQVSVGTLE